jgi:hypothetical protein
MTSFVAALQRTINAEVIPGHPLQNGYQAAKRLGTDEATTTLTNTVYAIGYFASFHITIS